jgi:hypothetical protein
MNAACMLWRFAICIVLCLRCMICLFFISILANRIRGYTGKTHLRGFKFESASADFVCLAAVLTAVATQAKPTCVGSNLSPRRRTSFV